MRMIDEEEEGRHSQHRLQSDCLTHQEEEGCCDTSEMQMQKQDKLCKCDELWRQFVVTASGHMRSFRDDIRATLQQKTSVRLSTHAIKPTNQSINQSINRIYSPCWRALNLRPHTQAAVPTYIA